MKRRLQMFGFFTILVLAMMLSNTIAQNFGNQSLKGSYGLIVEGTVFRNSDLAGPVLQGPIYFTNLGLFIADGNGVISNGMRSINFQGLVLQDTFTGSYLVNANGTATLTLMGFFEGEQVTEEVYDCVLIDAGKQVECAINQFNEVFLEKPDVFVGTARFIRQ